MKLKKWTTIHIDWVDSMHDSGWTHEDDLELDDKYLKKESIGFFYQQTKQAISIVQNKDNDGMPKQSVDSVMTIPKVAITKITIVSKV